MYKRSIKLMFITQTNDFGSVIWKIEQHICQSKKVTNVTPPLPPKYSMLKHFDVIQKLVYPGYQRFFSRAAGIFGVGRRPTHFRP